MTRNVGQWGTSACHNCTLPSAPVFGNGELKLLCLTTNFGSNAVIVSDSQFVKTRAVSYKWVRDHGKGAELQQLIDAANRDKRKK